MIRGSATVEYVDGRTASVVLRPIDFSRAERWLTSRGLIVDPEKPTANVTNVLLTIHSALAREHQIDGLGFEPWAESVADVIELDVVAADPTPKGTSVE